MPWTCNRILDLQTGKGGTASKLCDKVNDDSFENCAVCGRRNPLAPARVLKPILIGVKPKGDAERFQELLTSYQGKKLKWKSAGLSSTLKQVQIVGKDVKAATGNKVAPLASAAPAGAAQAPSTNGLKAALENQFSWMTGAVMDEIMSVAKGETLNEVAGAVASMIPVLKEILAFKGLASASGKLATGLHDIYDIGKAEHIANTSNYEAVARSVKNWLKGEAAKDGAKVVLEAARLFVPGSSAAEPVIAGGRVFYWLAGIGYEARQKIAMNEALQKPLTREIILKYPLLGAMIFSGNGTSVFLGIWGAELGTVSMKDIEAQRKLLRIEKIETHAASIMNTSRLEMA